MPSTYSTSLKLELIGNGEQAGAWGTTTNNNLGTLLEQAITGVLTLPLYGTDVTLTNYNGLSDQARNAVIILTGNLTAACNVIAPSGQQKTYIVRNRANASVTIKTTGGNGITIANAASEVIFTDGTDFYSATQFNYINGDLTVTGNVTVGGTVTIGGDVYGNTNTGQWYIPTGNTVSRAANGTNGLFRYNTDLKIYEGYQNNVWVKFITANELNYSADYLVAAGGGGGGAGSPGGYGGGGGAGGFFTGSFTVTSGVVYTFTVGAGGAAQTTGTNSSLTGIFTAFGGGRGGDTGTANAGSGGSGGGGAYATSGGSAGGSGVSGQGNKGGDNFDTYYGGGGGGGASFAGAYANNGSGGAGGGGTASSITGVTVTYAGGGGGGASSAGGAGGGGGAGSPGTTYTGGGGGAGAAGGSGVIIISVPTASYSGTYTGTPIITTSGSNTILKYIVSGTYTG
jgi:hypothetical protein